MYERSPPSELPAPLRLAWHAAIAIAKGDRRLVDLWSIAKRCLFAGVLLKVASGLVVQGRTDERRRGSGLRADRRPVSRSESKRWGFRARSFVYGVVLLAVSGCLGGCLSCCVEGT